jgi:hypothetical protein
MVTAALIDGLVHHAQGARMAADALAQARCWRSP